MTCENCNVGHDGSYGSGRFCSSKCARGFSTKDKREEINKKVSKSLSQEIICISCGKKLKQKRKHCLCRSCLYKSQVFRNNVSEKSKGKTGGQRQGSGRGKHGWYKGYWCDSSWELAFVIYNLEHNIKFVRNTEGFEYEWEGETHKYYPDFIIEEMYYEIKGYDTEQNNVKHSTFKKPLIVLKKEGIKTYIEYVENKYGKDFIELYE